MSFSEKVSEIERMLKELVGLQLFKSWNIFATRMFYFAAPGFENQMDDGDYRLTLECPWRIEQHDRIFVGSEDYGLRSTGNSDPDWNPTDMQWGHLQDEKLEQILGESKNGAIFNTRSELIVESVKADSLGGFQVCLSGGYTLSAFPARGVAMEWLLSRRAGGNLALANGSISGPPKDSAAPQRFDIR